ncbi:cellulose binding domain-containing protein [Endozoicomonas ascidiicola]|uniref:cellulose binding domain-containing protein n=1 Tax=Endozoicomonas ascidiicola TaxID=1698521 RepID=UPI00083521C0|nr:cellulose binding domain-containing protein [Endozoicomonas ascidiicola]
MRINPFRSAVTLLLSSALSAANANYDGSNGPGVPQTGYSAGEYLSHVPYGGRMVTFHRGYLYLMGQGSTSLWDVSDPISPVMVHENKYGDNGHRWYKLNTDLFWREYSMPELGDSHYNFLNLSDMLDLKPWTAPNVPVPINKSGQLEKWQVLETFPTGTSGSNVHDLRFANPDQNPNTITSTFSMDNAGINSSLRFRIGNLMFVQGNGLAVFDIGDPDNIRLLDSLVGNFNQYTTTYHVWRDKVVFLNGNDANEDKNNLVMIDFSDPTDLKYAGGVPFSDSPGRYMYFQDEYGFAGSDSYGVKINLETLKVEQKIEAPGPWPDTFLDFQWMPLGNLLAISGSNGGDGKTFFYSHQDGLDTRPPEVGFHHPFANATGQPLTTVVGFSISEILDERTLTDTNIQLRKVGTPDLIPGDIVSTSYQTVNFTPQQLLNPDSTYRVTFINNGVKDVAGNGFEEFSFLFSTGSEVNDDPAPIFEGIDLSVEGPILQDETIAISARASDEQGDTLEYRWDFGNGSNSWSNSPDITYAFTTPGLHTVSLQVRDPGGNIISQTLRVVVVEELYEGMPAQSSQLAMHNELSTLAAVNPDNNSLALINTDTLTVMQEISVCDDPVSITRANDNFWVACRDSSEVMVINTSSGNIVDTLPLPYGAKPIAIMASVDQHSVYVSEMGSGSVSQFNSADHSLINRVSVGSTPRALGQSLDGNTLLVSRFISSQDQGEVWNLNPGTLSLQTQIPLPMDTTTLDTSTGGRGIPNYLTGLALHPDGQSARVVGKKDNVLRGLFKDGQVPSFETTVRSLVASLNINASEESTNQRVDIDNHSQPSAVTYDQYGSYLFVAMQGSNRVIVLNPNSGQEIARIDVGLAPQALLLDQSGQRLYVKNFMGRSVSVVDLSELLTNGTDRVNLMATISTVGNEALDAEVLRGKQIFYNAADTRMTMDGYLTCATCHLDGEQDGRVWDFTNRGEGLRNTISLKGRGGTDHGRVHWSANFDEIQDFEHDIRGPAAGTGLMSNASFNLEGVNHPLGTLKTGLSSELDALAAYVASLKDFDPSSNRTESGDLTADAQAGKVLFDQANCASCHSGTGYTDSPKGLMHDVGTLSSASGQRLSSVLSGLDTPTLRDLSHTAPYLHDGSAETVSELFGFNNAHGKTADLSATEVNQLTAYLLQIDGSSPDAPESTIQLGLKGIENGTTIKSDSVTLELESNLSAVSAVEYFVDGQLAGVSSTKPYEVSWTPDEPGVYRLQVKALHNQGLTASLSPEATVEIGANGNCRIDYRVMQDWGSGFQVDVSIHNTGSEVVRGFDLNFLLGNGQVITSGWNATLTSSGQQITATNPAGHWNGNIAAGGSVSFGFQGNKSGAMIIPDSFSLNGSVCETE